MPMAKSDALAFKITLVICAAIVLIFLSTYYALYFDNYEVLIVKNKSVLPDEELREAKQEHMTIKSPVPEELLSQQQVMLRHTLEHITGFNASRLCVPVIENDGNKTSNIIPVMLAKTWKFNEAEFHKWLFTFGKDEDECSSISRKLSFFDSPLSDEEAEYPLAYGMLVFKNSPQIYTMLSAIYHPQNVYVIAVDEKATKEFKKDMDQLAFCFPNIHVIHVSEVMWCKSSVLNALFTVFRYMVSMKHNWRYFQYLSGVDLPLKTNLEMVRIFKQMNATVNADVIRHNPGRTRMMKKKPPLRLWKSSMSALIPREAAEAILAAPKVRELIRWLQPTDCPDETFWTTITANPFLKIPGGFPDAQSVFDQIINERMERQKLKKQEIAEYKLFPSNRSLEEPFELFSYYISRYQVWNVDHLRCGGKIVKESCVFGLGDLPELLRRPEIVAHKFYWDYDPAVYFCIYKEIRERALDKQSQSRFRGENYRWLPQVRMRAGEPLQNVSFHINAFPDFHFS